MGDRGTGLVTVPFTDDKTLHNSIQFNKHAILDKNVKMTYFVDKHDTIRQKDVFF
jgi:hypothetical protein